MADLYYRLSWESFVQENSLSFQKSVICLHQLDISFLSSCSAVSLCRYSQLLIVLKPHERWDQLKRAWGYFLYRNGLYSPVKGGVKVSHFSVTILKSGPSLNLPRFLARPAFILLISTSGLIRMETVFHPEMGPVL